MRDIASRARSAGNSKNRTSRVAQIVPTIKDKVHSDITKAALTDLDLDPDYFYIRLDTEGAVHVIAKAFAQKGHSVKKDMANKTVAVRHSASAA